MAGANGERQSFLRSERGDNYLLAGQFLLIKFQNRKYFISIINFCTDFVKSSLLVISWKGQHTFAEYRIESNQHKY